MAHCAHLPGSFGQAAPGPWRRDRLFLAGADRLVFHRAGPASIQLKIDSIGSFAIGPRRAVYTGPGGAESTRDRARLVDLILASTGVVLSLALRGRFVLHASAVVRRGGAELYAGPSGAGKSTIARALAEAGLSRRIADDVVEVRWERGRWVADGRLPQLKVHPPLRDRPQWAPLRAILVVQPGRGEVEVDVGAPLGVPSAAVEIFRRVVATRLMPPPLVSQAMDHAAHIARTGPPVRLLRYARTPAALAALLALEPVT